MEKERVKMQKICAGMDIALLVSSCILLVMAVVQVGMGIYLVGRPESEFSVSVMETSMGAIVETSYEMEDGALKDMFTGNTFEPGILSQKAEEMPKTAYLIGEAGGILRMFLGIFMLWMIRRVFTDIKKLGTPFTDKSCRFLMWAGIAIIAIEYVEKGIKPLMAMLCGISGGTYNFVYPLGMGVVVFCFYSIFRYGCVLQQESDETL